MPPRSSRLRRSRRCIVAPGTVERAGARRPVREHAGDGHTRPNEDPADGVTGPAPARSGPRHAAAAARAGARGWRVTWFSSPADAADRLGRRRLPRRRRHRHDGVPRRRAGEAAAGRGPRRRRQDRAGQGGRAGDRRRAGAAAVLRGPRRGAGALRVELQEAAAAHPGRPGRRPVVERDPRRHLHRGVPAHPAAADRDPARASRPCCSSTRSTRPTSRSRGCCSRCSPTSRSPSPSSAPSAAVRRPFVVLTSNATRELSEALKRRCLYLHLDYPDAEREREIVTSQVPDLEDRVAEQLVDDRRPAARPRAEEGAVDRRVRRLGAHPDRAGDPRPRRQGRRRHPRRGPQARLRPRARDPGAAAPA